VWAVFVVVEVVGVEVLEEVVAVGLAMVIADMKIGFGKWKELAEVKRRVEYGEKIWECFDGVLESHRKARKYVI